jgi:hypothetical protein
MNSLTLNLTTDTRLEVTATFEPSRMIIVARRDGMATVTREEAWGRVNAERALADMTAKAARISAGPVPTVAHDLALESIREGLAALIDSAFAGFHTQRVASELRGCIIASLTVTENAYSV